MDHAPMQISTQNEWLAVTGVYMVVLFILKNTGDNLNATTVKKKQLKKYNKARSIITTGLTTRTQLLKTDDADVASGGSPTNLVSVA